MSAVYSIAEKFKYNLVDTATFETLVNEKNGEQLITYMLELSEANRHNPRNALVIRHDQIPTNKALQLDLTLRVRHKFEHPWACLCVGKYKKDLIYQHQSACDRLKSIQFINSLPFAGKYVLAGGSVVGAYNDTLDGNNNKEDLDFDFYPIYNVEYKMLSHAETVGSYRTFLQDMEEINIPGIMTVKSVIRGEHCTTIHSFGPSYGVKAQMVHRGHPSPVSVVASFDHMCCRGFYDGESIYFTLEAALCMYFKINPIDWRRESPTHLQRGLKYHNRGFQMIFPGLPFARLREANMAHALNQSYCGGDRPYEYPLIEGACQIVSSERKGVTYWSLDFHVDPDAPEESDYVEAEDPAVESFNYGGLSTAIVQKRPIPYLITDSCAAMIEGGQELDIRPILERVSRNGGLYYGDLADEMTDIQKKMTYMLLKSGGTRRESRMVILPPNRLQALMEMQRRANEILDILTDQYDILLSTQRKLLQGVIFEIDNPGKQFSGSFSPIVRNHPAKYFGPRYDDEYAYRNLYEIKKLFLLQARFGNDPVWYGLNKDVLRMLFAYFYRSYFLPSVVG
jgi:hypothetical protein